MVKVRMSYKKDNVEYVFACNYDDFNNQFKEKINRDATEAEWNLFKERFNAIRTDKIAEWFEIDITEIIDDNYERSDMFICEGCDEKCVPDGLEVSCDACDKKHGCSECNGGWDVRERHFCKDCNTGHGYDMFCCHQCGYDGEEEKFRETEIDNEIFTFCSLDCHKKYIES